MKIADASPQPRSSARAASPATTSRCWSSAAGQGLTARPVHVGCSGWVYPDWRGRIYPEGLPQRRWLAHYAELLRHRRDQQHLLPARHRASAVEGWVEQTPDDFVFTVKASRYLTHVKRLKELGPLRQALLRAARGR